MSLDLFANIVQGMAQYHSSLTSYSHTFDVCEGINLHAREYHMMWCMPSCILVPMIGENRQLVTDEPVDFEK